MPARVRCERLVERVQRVAGSTAHLDIVENDERPVRKRRGRKGEAR